MPSLWSEHRTSEGRLYWSNAETKQSVWEKPDELRTPFEKELAKTDWKQYTSKDKPYYVNSVTKETKWELPEELQAIKARLEAPAEATPTPGPAPSASPEKASSVGSGTPNASTPNVAGRTFLPLYPTTMTRYSPSQVPTGPKRELPPKWPVGGFLTHEKAEDAFFKLLKYEGVDEHSTWEDTMRKIITHELYKALETLAQKKAAFVKYQHKIVEDRQAAKESRVNRMRPVLRALFESRRDVIKGWSTVKTANKVFEGERQWRTAFEDEREAILAEYTKELREAEEKEERELKERNITKLAALVRELESINIGTRWRQAHDLVVSSDSFKSDEELQKIDTIDMMGVYDEYMRQLESGQEDEARRYRLKMARAARKARDGFRALMHEMAEKGELTMESKWKEVHERIKDDERYLALIGQPGSGPLELWMDAVDDLAEETYGAAEKLDKAFKALPVSNGSAKDGAVANGEAKDGQASSSSVSGNGNGDANGDAQDSMDVDGQPPTETETESSTTPGKITLSTPFSTFTHWLTLLPTSAQPPPALAKRIYDMHIRRLTQQAADDARRAERKRRHRVDDLRYALKGVAKDIEGMEWDEAKGVLEGLGLREWEDVRDEEGRKEAWERFVRRQKEKAEERERYEKRHSKSARYSEEREKERESERDTKRPRLSTKEVEEGEI